MYSSHAVTVIGLCPPASAPCCNVGTRSTSVPCMLIDLFFYHYTPVNHTNTQQHTRTHRERWMDGWMMDGTCKPPKKGWKKTVSTLGRQSNTEFFPPGLPPSAPSSRRERGGFFLFFFFLGFSHRNKPQANKQLIARENPKKRKENDLSLLSGTKVEPTKGMAKALSGNGKRLFVP